MKFLIAAIRTSVSTAMTISKTAKPLNPEPSKPPFLLKPPSPYPGLSRFHFKGCKVLNTLFMAGLFINVNYIVVPIF